MNQDKGFLSGPPHYLIHTCNKRQWYVYDFLIPSLIQQGIKQEQIKVWHDYKRVGNLGSFLACMEWIEKKCDKQKGIWHLQDDICISKKFKETTEEYDQGIVCGFVHEKFNKPELKCCGLQPVEKIWYSFPCIRLPNKYSGEFLKWLFDQGVFDSKIFGWYKTRKNDDTLWSEFIKRKHPEEYTFNLNPNIINHIDYLLGGSQVNSEMNWDRRESYYWGQRDIMQELIKKLEKRYGRSLQS